MSAQPIETEAIALDDLVRYVIVHWLRSEEYDARYEVGAHQLTLRMMAGKAPKKIEHGDYVISFLPAKPPIPCDGCGAARDGGGLPPTIKIKKRRA